MEFFPYQKISSTSSQFHMIKGSSKNLFKGKWIVLEKVHGANFSVYCNAQESKFAKRTTFLEKNEWFYNYHTISHDLQHKVKAVFDSVLTKDSDVDYVIVYGELCGGFYPSAPQSWKGALEAGRINSQNKCLLDQNHRAIQEGVYYSPDIVFIVFDIALVKRGKRYFIGYDDVMFYCKEAKLNYLRPLLVSSANECANYKCTFDSKVSVDICKQMPLPKGSNLAEGIVVKPMNVDIYDDIRPMLKVKHSKFSEISSDFLSNDSCHHEILDMVNMNRLDSLRSKLGGLSKTQSAEIVTNLVEDIYNDYWNMVYDNQRDAIDEGDTYRIHQLLVTNCTQLVASYFSIV